ncbi:DUF6297 family protein [Cellulomonas bogoriensis]
MTRRVQDAREGRGWSTVVGEVWGGLVTLAVVASLTGWVAMGMDRRATLGVAREDVGDLPGLLVLLVIGGGLLGLAGRLGPVGVGEGGSGWWLPLPVDRRGLLRPAVLAWPPAATVAGAALAPLAVLALGAPATVERVLGWAAVGGAFLAALAAGATLAQGMGRAGRSSRSTGVVGDVVMVAGTGGLVAVSLAPTVPEWHLGASPWVAAPLLVITSVLTVLAERRAGALDGAALRTFGAVGGRVRVAILTLDLRELGRALTSASVRARRRSRALHPGGPRRTVVLADALLAARTPRSLAQAAAATLLAIASTGLPTVSEGLPRYGVLLVTGYWAANAVAGGARHGDLVPALGRLLPLSERSVRFAHVIVPLTVSALWAVAVMGTAALHEGDPRWLAPRTVMGTRGRGRDVARGVPSAAQVPGLAGQHTDGWGPHHGRDVPGVRRRAPRDRAHRGAAVGGRRRRGSRDRPDRADRGCRGRGAVGCRPAPGLIGRHGVIPATAPRGRRPGPPPGPGRAPARRSGSRRCVRARSWEP